MRHLLRLSSSRRVALILTASPTRRASTLSSSQLDQTFVLPDGRTLGYAEYGSSNGIPLFYFHGYPSSRIEPIPVHEIAQKLNLRLIAPDRPGFGLSSLQSNRRILDWPTDVLSIAQHLELGRFAVMGCSGGGPYALACAYSIPGDVLSGVGVFAGAAPWEASPGTPLPLAKKNTTGRRILATIADHAPSALRVGMDALVGTAQWLTKVGPVTRRLDAWLEANEGEHSTLTTEQRRERLLRILFEGFARGAAGMVQETQLLVHDWGFKLEDITYDTVKVWHGAKDINAPISMVRYMVNRLPHATLTEYPDDTHYTMGAHFEEVLADLVPDDAKVVDK